MNPPWDPAEVAIGYTNHLAFHVDDLDAALERAREHGVEPAGEVFARGDGVRRTFVTDPDGHVIELMETGVPVTGSEPRLQRAAPLGVEEPVARGWNSRCVTDAVHRGARRSRATCGRGGR